MLGLGQSIMGPVAGGLSFAQAKPRGGMHMLGQVVKVEKDRLQTEQRQADLPIDPDRSVEETDGLVRPFKADLLGIVCQQWGKILAELLSGKRVTVGLS